MASQALQQIESCLELMSKDHLITVAEQLDLGEAADWSPLKLRRMIRSTLYSRYEDLEEEDEEHTTIEEQVPCRLTATPERTAAADDERHDHQQRQQGAYNEKRQEVELEHTVSSCWMRVVGPAPHPARSVHENKGTLVAVGSAPGLSDKMHIK